MRLKIDKLPGSRVAFIPLSSLFDECNKLRTGHDSIQPLQCLRGSCSVDKCCMTLLAPRVKAIFDSGAVLELLIVHWNQILSPYKHGCTFWADNRNPEIKVFRPDNFKEMMKDTSKQEVFIPCQ